MIRLILASEHPLIRAGIRWVLSTEKEVEILGEAGNKSETIQKCVTLSPHILLLDVSRSATLPNEFIRQVRDTCPDLGVVLCMDCGNGSNIPDLMKLGVKGYLLSDEAAKDIRQAISVVGNGGFWFSKSAFDTTQHKTLARSASESILTDRETEVVKLLGEGLNNEEIARSLCISVRTVRFHMANLMQKLGASNRISVINIARRKGLIEFPSLSQW